MEKQLETNLRRFATEIRIATLKQFEKRGFGHLGGCMSITDTLAVLYGSIMNIDPKKPDWADRDYLVMSKGHAGPAVYAALALKGYFPMEQLETLNQNNTNLPSHCDRLKTVGIDMTTGSLGQGVSSGLGIALANKVQGKKNYTYVVAGDGECNEGQVWEAIMFAANQKLDHYFLFIDYNRQQLDGFMKDVSGLDKFEEKLQSFGFEVKSVDGHNIAEIYTAITDLKKTSGKPCAIVLNTIKGKGVPKYESAASNHHVDVKAEEMAEAIKVLQATLKEAN